MQIQVQGPHLNRYKNEAIRRIEMFSFIEIAIHMIRAQQWMRTHHLIIMISRSCRLRRNIMIWSTFQAVHRNRGLVFLTCSINISMAKLPWSKKEIQNIEWEPKIHSSNTFRISMRRMVNLKVCLWLSMSRQVAAMTNMTTKENTSKVIENLS